MSCCQNNKEARSDSAVYNYQYEKLKNVSQYKCEPGCFCRFMDPPSKWDQLQFNWMEKGQKPNIPPASAAFIHSWGGKK